jgi:hypothetical protein
MRCIGVSSDEEADLEATRRCCSEYGGGSETSSFEGKWVMKMDKSASGCEGLGCGVLLCPLLLRLLLPFRKRDSNEGLEKYSCVVGLKFPFQVAEAGNLGGGISFCFEARLASSFSLSLSAFSALSASALARWEAFEELRFQLRLSFRRSDVVEAGVLGSSEVDVRVDAASRFVAICGFGLGR